MYKLAGGLLGSLGLVFALAGCGSGSGSDDLELLPVETTYNLEAAFSSLNFSAITDLQSQPYPAASTRSGDRLFVVQREGLIEVFDNASGTRSSSIFLDISDRVTSAGEQGLLGLAFHPDFDTNGHFYVHYVVDTPAIPQRVRISRFTVPDQGLAPNSADPSSEQIVLVVDQAGEGPPATNHNGGSLAFSPINGFLHISVGDGGGANDPAGNGQDLSTLSGSVLRIDVDNPGAAMNYSIPASNPFVGTAGARGEVFAYGLRNPFKMSFDGAGNLWIADVGQSAFEEINLLAGGDESGVNYGWDCREGTQAGAGPDAACAGQPAAAFTDPVFQYGLSGGQSITGGYVVPQSGLPGLAGQYVYGDFIGGQVWSFDPASGANRLLVDSGMNISSFGLDASGAVFVAEFGGNLFRLIEQ